MEANVGITINVTFDRFKIESQNTVTPVPLSCQIINLITIPLGA